MPQTPRGEQRLSGRGFKKHVGNPKSYLYNNCLNFLFTYMYIRETRMFFYSSLIIIFIYVIKKKEKKNKMLQNLLSCTILDLLSVWNSRKMKHSRRVKLCRIIVCELWHLCLNME